MPVFGTQMFGSAPAEPVTISFIGTAADTDETDAYTFSSQSIGTAATGRLVVVGNGNAGGGSGTSAATSFTIAGVTASIIAQATAYDQTHVALWGAVVDSGTSGDIVMEFDRNANGAYIAVWAVYDANTTADDTGSDTQYPGNTPYTTTLDVPAIGGAIACSTDSAGGGAATHTWAGLTEDFDLNFKGSQAGSGSHKVLTTAQSGITVSSTPSKNTHQGSLCCASWGPA